MHRLENAWIALRSSLWFLPSLIVTGAVALAITLIEIDARVDQVGILSQWPRLFGAGAEGTRGMLVAIGSAMITVAGVVFSITIVALSLASSQYTPRMLRNFMRDRSNQVVLGAFVGIYAYCLVVLRTIRGGAEGAFVPSLAALGAMLLAFVGIALLIHFIHHISSAIQAGHILAAISRETSATIARTLPERLAPGEDDRIEEGAASARRQGVAAKRTGYVQNVGSEVLLQCACRLDAVVRLPHRVGDFVVEGQPLVTVDGGGKIDDELAAALRGAVSVGDQRTVEQDVAFGLRQIVDIALKAVSPGINDPTTATMCLDYLSALLVDLATRRFPDRPRYDQGRLRVVAEVPTFASLLALAIEEIRLTARDQPVVLRKLIDVLARVTDATGAPSRRAALRLQLGFIGDATAGVDDAQYRALLAFELTQAQRRLE
ncbi:MAG: DUF2254 domain-containing protein [Rudaea sp.]